MTPNEIKNKIIDPWHFMRTCTQCDYIWHGLHCIHDGVQNACGKCGDIMNKACQEKKQKLKY